MKRGRGGGSKVSNYHDSLRMFIFYEFFLTSNFLNSLFVFMVMSSVAWCVPAESNIFPSNDLRNRFHHCLRSLCNYHSTHWIVLKDRIFICNIIRRFVR
jgi:hypothetical protein